MASTSSKQHFFSLFDGCLHHQEGLRGVTSLQEAVASLQEAAEVQPASHAVVSEKGRRETALISDVPDKMVCTTCRWPLNNREEQTEHYKLDWHRFNLKQRVTGLAPVTVEEFEKKTGAGDMSSISGSDSDSEDEDGDRPGKSAGVPGADDDDDECSSAQTEPSRLASKVAFRSPEGQYLVVHRCVLQGKSDGEGDLVDCLKAITEQTVWVVLMTGGGHFAGAVFKGKEVIQHKTFHRYTVRAKRGTAQGLRDAQNRGHAPKSAGAALRRYNEAALLKDIQELLDSWAELLKDASAIFLRAPSYNKTMFFGGRDAPLDKKDPRIRTLPFATRRATFREVQRVHNLLSTVQTFEKETDLSVIFSPSKKQWKKAPKSTALSNSSEEKADEPGSSDDDDDDEELGESILETVEVEVGTLHLREYEVQPSRHRRKKRRKKKEVNKMDDEELNIMGAGEKLLEEVEEEVEEVEEEEMLQTTPPENTSEEMPTKSKAKRKGKSKKKQLEGDADESWEYSLRDGLYTACKTGDIDALRRLLRLPGRPAAAAEEEEERGSPEEPGDGLTLVNKPLDASGFTLLHVSSAAGQRAVVQLLMDAGADPACRDNKGQTPYLVAPEKDTRNVFRKYMADNPDKYDYSKAQVPGPLTEEIELKQTEKKRAQKAAKKQREKEQKEEKRKLELEAAEKKRFASLTDREKRALAAEKRLAEQAAATRANLSNIKRCWQCGESLLGKIPFQYLDFSFCTPRCVQAHRKAGAAPATNTT